MFQRLKLKHDRLLSNVAFNCNLRPCNLVEVMIYEIPNPDYLLRLCRGLRMLRAHRYGRIHYSVHPIR